MRILVSVDPEIEVPPKKYGGIERIVDGLVRTLRARGHTVGLVAKDGSECPADAFFPWPGALSQSKRDTALNTWTLWRAKRAFKPDLIHSFSRIAYLTPHLRGTTPVVMSFQRDPTGRTVRMANTLARPGTISFTGCSNYLANVGRNAGGGEWKGIHNFAGFESLHFSPSVPDDAPLVFLSRIEEIKGAHWAIEIAKRAGKRLIIAGTYATWGEAGDFWKTKVEPEIGKNNIEYIGPVGDVEKNKLLGGAAAMVVPIQWEEPFGIVFAESLACGTPVITCARGAIPEIVQDGVHGFLIKSVDEGVRAVQQLGTIDRATCRAHAQANFTPDVIVDRYIDLYRERIARATGAAEMQIA